MNTTPSFKMTKLTFTQSALLIALSSDAPTAFDRQVKRAFRKAVRNKFTTKPAGEIVDFSNGRIWDGRKGKQRFKKVNNEEKETS